MITTAPAPDHGMWITHHRTTADGVHDVTPRRDELTALRSVNDDSDGLTVALFVLYGQTIEQALAQNAARLKAADQPRRAPGVSLSEFVAQARANGR